MRHQLKLSVIQTKTSIKNALAAKEVAEISKRSLEVSQGANLSISTIQLKHPRIEWATHGDHVGDLIVEIRIENVGPTRAVNVFSDVAMSCGVESGGIVSATVARIGPLSINSKSLLSGYGPRDSR